eukprot:3389957-Amphidinium_carterae.2
MDGCRSDKGWLCVRLLRWWMLSWQFQQGMARCSERLSGRLKTVALWCLCETFLSLGGTTGEFLRWAYWSNTSGVVLHPVFLVLSLVSFPGGGLSSMGCRLSAGGRRKSC